ncbi:processed acidic surface protein [Evansella cellulosilytica]|uniref:LPXTG-motif cell wall anchor domain protein n=1 Tax=Evansella cellulosilytica (strain ATCC 21833 / DSM 2522 / FERM P-1141 / JCM 9156 / N-4) TaxID=649639 RepID=E6TZ72_EVAC2|nr:processed acidic surface protein [Evansella cellulosilytica]ADU28934.1 LPXTG-motif cell wall anchor domain protein [Evansella cellulosilytica DSM 2522]
MKKLVTFVMLAILAFTLVPQVTSAAVSNEELDSYLVELNWEKGELEEYLASFWLELSDFDDIEELKDFLGPVITDEFVNKMLVDYDITLTELEAILAEYGVSLDELKFTFDLEFYLEDYFYGDDWLSDYVFEFFQSIGIDEDEFFRLLEHLEYVYHHNPNLENELEALLVRILALGDFESASELSAEDVAELLYIGEELARILEINTEFFLVKKDEKQSISLSSLFALTSTNGYDLLIELYNYDDEFLADILLTADLFGSELIKDTGKTIVEASKEVSENDVVKTEKGGKLPNTATHSLLNILLGFFASGAGLYFFRKVKVL